MYSIDIFQPSVNALSFVKADDGDFEASNSLSTP